MSPTAIDALDAGAQPLVGRHEAAVEGDAGLGIPQALGDRATADGDEEQVGLDRVAALQRDA